MFRALMIARGASIHIADTFEAYRIKKNNRLIEIYLNRPSNAGLKKGLDELARILDGAGLMKREKPNNPTKMLPKKKAQERAAAKAGA